MTQTHLIPENIKNIVSRANPTNLITNDNEKMIALSQLQAISDYCRDALAKYGRRT